MRTHWDASFLTLIPDLCPVPKRADKRPHSERGEVYQRPRNFQARFSSSRMSGGVWAGGVRSLARPPSASDAARSETGPYRMP